MSLRPSLLRLLPKTQINPQIIPNLRQSSPFSTIRASQPRKPSTFQRQIQAQFQSQSPFKRQSRFNSSRHNQSHTNSSRQGHSNSNSSSGSSSGTGPNSSSRSSKEPTGLSARLKKLTREYGWAALGVYLTLSALDFPFCFAAVRLLGVERIGHFEHVALSYLKGVFGSFWPKPLSSSTSATEGEGENQGQGQGENQVDSVESQEEKQGEASIWTQLVFAYAIHKSLLIFVRVPLTAAVTPKVVKVLRGWGWDIGKRKPKST